MAKSNDHIYVLIKSLTDHERSIYRQSVETSNFGQAHMAFLELIDAMEAYDEEKASFYCRTELKVTNFSRFRKEVFDSLLAILEKNRRSKSEQEEIDRQIREVDVLIDKGLFDVARKHILSTKNRADRINYHHGKIEVLNREIRIMQNRPGSKGEQKVVSLNEELDIYLQDYQTSNRYRTLYHFMLILVRSTFDGEVTKASMQEIEKIMRHPLLQSDVEWPDIRSQMLYHSIHAKFARITGKHNDELQHQRNIVQLWKQDRNQIEANPSGYIKSLSILAELHRGHNSYSKVEFNRMLAELQAVVVNTYRDETEQFAAVALLRLIDGLNGTPREFEVLLTEYIPQLLQDMNTRNRPLPQSRELALYFNIAAAYFVHGSFSKAADVISLIRNFTKTDSRQDIQIFASILSNILMYEMFDEATAETFTRSNDRKLKNMALTLSLESTCIKFLKKLRTTLPDQDIQRVFVPWRTELLKLIKKNSRRQLLGLEEIICWLNSKISGGHIYAEYRKYIDESSVLSSPPDVSASSTAR